MSRSDRLLRLLHVIRTSAQPVTAAALARETEVSERTLYRDIESLRAAGALIDGAPGYGYCLTEDPALPPQVFSQLEIEALVLGLGYVHAQADEALADAAQVALSKITATLPERLQRHVVHAVLRVHKYHAPGDSSVDPSAIRQACWIEVALDICYRSAQDLQTQRRILPLSMVYNDDAIMLLAWCTLRNDFRMFRVSRIIELELTTESFRPRRVALLREYLQRLSGN